MPILITITIIYLYISIKHERLAMMLLLVSLPLYVLRFSVFGIPTTLLEVMILTLFAVFIFRNYKNIIERIRLKINHSFKKSSPPPGLEEGARPVPSDDGREWSEIKAERQYLHVGIKNQKYINYPFAPEIILVLMISFASLVYVGFGNSALGIWKAYFFEAIIVYILLFNIIFRSERTLRENLRDLIMPLAVSAFLVSLFAIYQKFTGAFIPNEFWADADTRRVTGIFGYPNALALYLGPITMMILAFLFSEKSKYQARSCQRVECEKWQPFSLAWFREMPVIRQIQFSFLKISFLVSVLAIYFARSEGALIALLVSVSILFFLSFPGAFFSPARKRLLALFVLLVIVVGAVAPLRDIALKHLALNDFSGQIRKAQWEETGVFLRDSQWLWGAGLNAYQEKIEPYHKQGIYIRNDDPDFEELITKDPEYQKKHWQALEIFLYPHNIFLNFWVEIGLLGMLVFVWIIYKTLFSCFSRLNEKQSPSRRLLILLPAMSMLTIVIHGIVDVPYFKNDLSVLFWLVVAMAGLLLLPVSKSGSDRL